MKPSPDPRLVKGIDEFNERLFFECHETLEEIWLEEHGEDRLFYQGLIQVAAGYLKWEQGVLIGAIKLWQRGLEKLDAYPPIHLGVDLGPFTHEVNAHLAIVEAAHARGENAVELSVPVLSLHGTERREQ
jgi:predicted metal-dependent hydrolase